MKKKLRPLTESKRYESFVKERDKGLERVLNKYLDRIDAVVHELHTRATEIASYLDTRGHGKEFAKRNRDEFQKRFEPWIEMGIHQIVALLKNLRRTTYVLSYAGQAEGMGRALLKPTKFGLTNQDVKDEMGRETHSGGEPFPRIELAMHRLMRDVLDAYQLSQVLESPIGETLERIDRAFPSKKKRAKIMAPMKEASRKKKEPEDEDLPVKGVEVDDGFTHFVNEDEWNDAVDDYLQENVPQGRGPYDSIFGTEEGEEGMRYRWEVEQEVSNDFVQSVRNGEVDAANENGVTDFVWIAIVDSHTDTCCMVRNGLLSAEIEEKMKTGDIDSEECDAIVPPAHMNCRCRPAAATEDLPEKFVPDFGGFDDWVASQGKNKPTQD